MTKYSGAVLIIGSLWWDPSPIRENWRITRLNKEKKQLVYAPIRYGRKSTSRGDTYTMVFSQLCYRASYRLGTALLVPFQNPVETTEELIQEASELWRVERKVRENRSSEVSLRWGAVGLKVGPGIDTSDPVIQGWVNHYHARTVAFEQVQTKTEEPIIDDQGLLRIRWLKDVEKDTPVEFDFILATATQPTLENGRYPSAKIIAEAWQRDKKTGGNHVEYFENNQLHKITTFQDEAIRGRLESQE